MLSFDFDIILSSLKLMFVLDHVGKPCRIDSDSLWRIFFYSSAYYY